MEAFCWMHERNEVPRKATREPRKAAREWVRKARAPNYDAPLLTTASEASGNVPPDQKTFSDFAETSLIISFKKEKFSILAVLRKTFLFVKHSNLNFQNRGYFG